MSTTLTTLVIAVLQANDHLDLTSVICVSILSLTKLGCTWISRPDRKRRPKKRQKNRVNSFLGLTRFSLS